MERNERKAMASIYGYVWKVAGASRRGLRDGNAGSV
jgi:hypothetical protein